MTQATAPTDTKYWSEWVQHDLTSQMPISGGIEIKVMPITGYQRRLASHRVNWGEIQAYRMPVEAMTPIDWEDAPKGATHYETGVEPGWMRVYNGMVFYRMAGEWVDYELADHGPNSRVELMKRLIPISA